MRELYLSTDVVQQAVIAQDKVIKMVAEAGSCVIVGRSADYVLRHNKNLVRIFLYAPKDYRTKKVMEMYGDTWGDPHQYELCIDSSVGTQKCAEIIFEYLSKRSVC